MLSSRVLVAKIKRVKDLCVPLMLRIKEVFLRRCRNYLQIAYTIIRNKRIIWDLSLTNDRLRFKFDALYWGIKVNRETENNIHNFRRNIHRLEKGLSYRETKGTFAEAYILETVNSLKEDEKNHSFDSNTRSWGISVLNLYFETCAHSEKISQAHDLYQSLDLKPVDGKCIPYLSSERPVLSVSYQSLYQLALRRRSIRHYLNKPVESQLIQEAMKIASLSPSACNRQSFNFLFFNDIEQVNKISNIPGGVKGYDLPSIVIVVGKYRGYFDARDINAPIIDSSLATMAFIFALETLGLSSVCINWPNLPDRERKIRELINLEKDEFIIMMIGVGYADPGGKIPYSAKKDLGDLLLINRDYEN